MILVIGDLHIRDELAYADYIPDRRMAERETVFDKIIESSKDCDKIVLLGDSLNSKNNSSESIKIFVDFIKKLQDNKRKIYILAGNHDKYANGKSAIDFLDKLKDENICTITKSNYRDDKLVFAPFTYPNEIGTNDLKKAANELFETMGDGDILFIHHISAFSIVPANMIEAPSSSLYTSQKKLLPLTSMFSPANSSSIPSISSCVTPKLSL